MTGLHRGLTLHWEKHALRVSQVPGKAPNGQTRCKDKDPFLTGLRYIFARQHHSALGFEI